MPLIAADGSLFKFVYRAEEKHLPVFRIKRNQNSVPYHPPDTVKQPNQTVAVRIQKISSPLQHQTTLLKVLGDLLSVRSVPEAEVAIEISSKQLCRIVNS